MDLSGYLLKPLRADSTFVLCRGEPGDVGLPILVLAPASPNVATEALQRLEHEYALANQLDSAWAAKPLTLMHDAGRPALVLKDPGGLPLDSVLEEPIEMTYFLKVAIGLAATLREVDGRGLLHKNIKPANVLVDALGNAWLTGVGLASRLLRKRQASKSPQVVAGTPEYMEPERTGRMNRSIDARSDLYYFGVTLYEMLTGPFVAADPMEGSVGFRSSRLALRDGGCPGVRSRRCRQVLHRGRVARNVWSSLKRDLVASGHRSPTIVITALGDDRLRVQALEAGAVRFFHKPIAKEELLSSIDLALTRK